VRSGCGFGDEERRVRRGLCLGGDGGGGEMCREGTREIAEGEGTCSVACRTGMGSNL